MQTGIGSKPAAFYAAVPPAAIISLCNSRRPQAWDVRTLQCLKTLEGHEDNVRVLAVGRGFLFSGSWDKTVRVWSADTLECVKVRAAEVWVWVGSGWLWSGFGGQGGHGSVV